jgi:radical SAM superfamily enzyme YgiQ (UPF0313 family)
MKTENAAGGILLINPAYELELRWVVNEGEIEAKADYLPLGLATVAALTAEGFHVDIWDEIVRGPIAPSMRFERSYDIVGITSCRANLIRAIELSRIFREKGILVAIGGPGVSGTPDRCRNQFDVLFIGEAELTWPKFLKDWKTGTWRTEYRQIDKPDLSSSPLPKWDYFLPDLHLYAQGCVQTTRGCPFDCEFCDVVFLNGRRQRHKTIARVLEEVLALQKLGMSSIFFNDDNFVGDPPYALDLLKQLIPLNNNFPHPLRFATQASIDTSRNEKLLRLLADANFYQLVIGLETPNKESLRETGKFHNLKGDLVSEVHRIQSYGIVVRGALVVGFDHDETDIFDKQYQFIQEACLPSVSLHMLNAPIGTRLWRRLRQEGRVIDPFKESHRLTQRLFNNVIPKRMSRIELMKGFMRLYLKVFSWSSFAERMVGFINLSQRAPKLPQEPYSLDELFDLGPMLHLDPNSQAAVKEILKYASVKAPHLVGRTKEMIVQFVRYSKSAHDFMRKFEKQIELEESGKVVYSLDTRPVMISDGIRKAFKNIFGGLYRRVYTGLEDKSRVPEVLLETFVEFLMHAQGINEIDDYHTALLNEIADRICIRFGGKAVEPEEISEASIPPIRGLRLDEDIIKSVEQELFRIAHAPTGAHHN